MKIAIIGPGAIGGTLAGWLSLHHDVTVCARTPFERLVLETPGRTITATLPVLTDPRVLTEPVDWILATTKTYDTEAAAAWIASLRGPGTGVAVVQNGVEHLSRFPDVPNVLPVIIDIPAEKRGPGLILQRRNGDITAPEGALGRAFCALFAGTDLRPTTTTDFTSAMWRKLALNTAGVVGAIVLQPEGIVHDRAAARLMSDITREAIAVGRAAGATLDDGLADEVVERLRAAPPETINSLLADRIAKRRTEIDARNGVIVRLGEQYGIPTPLNRMAVTLIDASHGTGKTE